MAPVHRLHIERHGNATPTRRRVPSHFTEQRAGGAVCSCGRPRVRGEDRGRCRPIARFRRTAQPNPRSSARSSPGSRRATREGGVRPAVHRSGRVSYVINIAPEVIETATATMGSSVATTAPMCGCRTPSSSNAPGKHPYVSSSDARPSLTDHQGTAELTSKREQARWAGPRRCRATASSVCAVHPDNRGVVGETRGPRSLVRRAMMNAWGVISCSSSASRIVVT